MYYLFYMYMWFDTPVLLVKIKDHLKSQTANLF